jgi:uncharacterized protein YjbJ (UPF0337 family)
VRRISLSLIRLSTKRKAGEKIMDKDRIKGKAKDLQGRVQRQAGEWTGNKEAQVEGAAKQAEGKVQNAFGKAKDAGREALDQHKQNKQVEQAKRQETERKKPAA